MTKVKLFVQALLHLSAVSLIFGGFATMYVNDHAVRAFVFAMEEESLKGDILLPLVILFGLAMCVWALVYITYELLKSNWGKRNSVVLRKSTGTIITETLIVMPLYLLLTFGMLQMSVNSMAGLLTTLGAFQAGRTLAVWAPEVGNDRGMGAVALDEARNRARLAAAGVIAPVTPVSNTALGVCAGQGGQANVNRMIQGLLLTGTSPVPSGESTGGSVWRALDGDMAFGGRGAAKLRLAYCATTVTYDSASIVVDPRLRDRNAFTTTINYRQPVTFPLVGLVFRSGTPGAPWATLDQSNFTRSYTTTQQMSPNTEMPQSGLLQGFANGLFGRPGMSGEGGL